MEHLAALAAREHARALGWFLDGCRDDAEQYAHLVEVMRACRRELADVESQLAAQSEVVTREERAARADSGDDRRSASAARLRGRRAARRRDAARAVATLHRADLARYRAEMARLRQRIEHEYELAHAWVLRMSAHIRQRGEAYWAWLTRRHPAGHQLPAGVPGNWPPSPPWPSLNWILGAHDQGRESRHEDEEHL